MDLGSRHKIDPSFNMSSMTDIVFLLLIFFMLTSNFQKVNQMPANLPEGGENVVESTKISVTINKNGNIFIGDDSNPVLKSSLKSALSAKLSGDLKQRKKEVISIHADVDVNYGDVADILKMTHELGAKSSLAMQSN